MEKLAVRAQNKLVNVVNFLGIRDERDFGLETETETRVVSVSVSSFETKRIKSRSQSQNLRLI